MHSPAVVSEQQNPSWFQVLDDVPGHGLHLAGADGGEDEDEGDHVQAVRGEGWLPVLGDVADPAVAAALAVLGMVLHQLDGSLTVVVVSRDQTVFSTLIGPELQSVTTPACQQSYAIKNQLVTSKTSLRDSWLPCTERFLRPLCHMHNT